MITLLTIGLILGLGLEPICDAIQDTLDHHQGQSIFSNKKRFKNQKWWNEDKGWLNKYVDYYGDIKKGIEPRRVKWDLVLFKMNKPVQFTDGWHFFKALKLISSISAQAILPSLFILTDYWWVGLISIVVMGMFRNSIFTLFYHKLLIK